MVGDRQALIRTEIIITTIAEIVTTTEFNTKTIDLPTIVGLATTVGLPTDNHEMIRSVLSSKRSHRIYVPLILQDENAQDIANNRRLREIVSN